MRSFTKPSHPPANYSRLPLGADRRHQSSPSRVASGHEVPSPYPEQPAPATLPDRTLAAHSR